MSSKAWTTLDEEWVKAVSAAVDISRRGAEIAEINGMRGRGEWHICEAEAEYTHTDGKVYRFEKCFRGGSGSETNRCFYFTPDHACTVTVVYASKPGRPVKICMADRVLASGTKEMTNGKAAAIFADICEISGKPVYIYGGACDKDIYAIFVDHFDPVLPPVRPAVPMAYKPVDPGAVNRAAKMSGVPFAVAAAERSFAEDDPQKSASIGENSAGDNPCQSALLWGGVPCGARQSGIAAPRGAAIGFAEVIHVGASRRCTTPAEAIAAIRRMARPAGEAGRVEVIIDPGVYPGQLIIDTPYVTIRGADKKDRPVIQWHYAVGYVYYSAKNGFYDPERAAARDTKGAVALWGAVCRVATEHVILRDCIFKNTFNCEITPEESADGCEAAKYNEYADVNEKPERNTPAYDPMEKSATERAAAIALEGDYAELYNCDFISSQDTFYVNGTAYVKDCYIEGVTDYVYGGSSAVFINCTLAWHGYTDKAEGGYISASKTSEKYIGKPDKNSDGFLFKDCVVTTSKYYPDNIFSPGAWGRNWGGEKSRAVFDGIRVKGIDPPKGWYELGGSLDKSEMYVNDVTDRYGNKVDVSGKEYNPNGTMSENG